MARIALEPVGDTASAESKVTITRTTFASAAGQEVASQGSGTTLRLSDDGSVEADTNTSDTDNQDTDDPSADAESEPAAEETASEEPDASSTDPEDASATETRVAAGDEALPSSETGTATDATSTESVEGTAGTGAGAAAIQVAAAQPGQPLDQEALAAARKKAQELRASVPGATDAAASEDGKTGTRRQRADRRRDDRPLEAPAKTVDAPGETAAPQPSTASPASSAAAATAPAPDRGRDETTKVAKAPAVTAAPDGMTDVGAAAKAATADVEGGGSNTMKIVLMAGVVAVLVAVFLVRKKLFS